MEKMTFKNAELPFRKEEVITNSEMALLKQTK